MTRFCTSCGSEIEDVKFCPNCGAPAEEKKEDKKAEKKEEVKEEKVEEKKEEKHDDKNTGSKSRIAAGILGIFFGCFGAHNFYLGYTGKAIAQLCLTLIGWILCFSGPVIAGVWGLIEGILILCGGIDTDAEGYYLDT